MCSFIGVARIFDLGGDPNHKPHAMMSSEILEGETKDAVARKIKSRGLRG